MWFFLFSLLMRYITFIALHIIPANQGKSHLVWEDALVMCCWIVLANILLRIFAFAFIRNIYQAYSSLFLLNLFFFFLYRN